MSMASNIPSPLVAWYPPPDLFKDVEHLRGCIGNVCLPCPYDIPLWGSQFGRYQLAYPYLATIALLSCLILLLCYAILSKAQTKRTVFTTGMAIGYLFLASAFLFSFTPAEQVKTVCYDSITRANALQNPRCAASGTFLVYGALSTRSWLAVWVFHMHMTIVWEKDLFITRKWLAYCLCCGIPLIFTLASIPFLEYTAGTVCLPRLGTPIQLLLELPMLVADCLGAICQGWTFGYILWVLHKQRYESGASRRASLTNWLNDSPLGQTLKLMAKPLLYTSLCLVNSLLFLVCFFTIQNPWDSKGHPTKDYLAEANAWILCLAKDGGKSEQCSAVNDSIFNWHAMVAGWYYSFIMATFFVLICLRRSTFIGLRDRLRNILHGRRNSADLDTILPTTTKDMSNNISMVEVKPPMMLSVKTSLHDLRTSFPKLKSGEFSPAKGITGPASGSPRSVKGAYSPFLPSLPSSPRPEGEILTFPRRGSRWSIHVEPDDYACGLVPLQQTQSVPLPPRDS